VPGQNYSYQAITAATEKRLNRYVEDARNNPEKAKAFHQHFIGAFWLWFDLTHDETNPDRDADGTRFMDLQLKFPE
jgi:hypothetical protein